jgi:hypothetical protein
MIPRAEVDPLDYISIEDDIAEQYKQVIQDPYYRYKLPSSLLDGGLPIMQEKEVIQIKTVPLYSQLKKNCYGRNVEFFVRNLPSFQKYADQDELDWVVTEHRRLVTEIFDYYRDKEPSLSTLEYRLKGIQYIIRLAYGRKTIPLYSLFSEIVYQIHYLT